MTTLGRLVSIRGPLSVAVLRVLVAVAMAIAVFSSMIALLLIAVDETSQGDTYDGLGTFLALLFLAGALPALGVLALDFRLLRQRPRAGAWLTIAIGAGITALGVGAGTQISEWLWAVPVGLVVIALAAWVLSQTSCGRAG